MAVQGVVLQMRDIRSALLRAQAIGVEGSLGALDMSRWKMFNAAANAVSSRETGLQDYETQIQQFPFRNLDVSLRLVKRVWRSNQDGVLAVNWLDVAEENDADIVFV